MANKDNLENGLQHSAASVSPRSPPHTQLPEAALLMFVLIWLPDSGWVGLKGGLCWRTLRCMAVVKTDWTRDNLTKVEGVMLHCSCRPPVFLYLLFLMTQETVGSDRGFLWLRKIRRSCAGVLSGLEDVEICHLYLKLQIYFVMQGWGLPDNHDPEYNKHLFSNMRTSVVADQVQKSVRAPKWSEWTMWC